MVEVKTGTETLTLSWEEFERRVRSGQVGPTDRVRFEPVTGEEWAEAQSLEMYRSLRDDATIKWQAQFLSGPPPLVTAILVGIQIRIWWFSSFEAINNSLVRDFTNFTAPMLEDFQIYRPLTMGIVHTDLFHVTLNMMWLCYTGWNIERAFGRKNLVALYTASVLGGSLFSMFGSPESPSLGASGGVFGLVAASVVFGFTRPELLGPRGQRLFGVAMLPYLLMMFWSGLMNESTDNWSHFGGLLVGGLLALVLQPEPLQRRPGWNASIRWGLVGLGTTILLSLGLLGPRIEPIADSSVVRSLRQRGVGAPSHAVSYAAPTGWRIGTSASGDSGFRSPLAPRIWSVTQREASSILTITELEQSFMERVRRGWPEATASPSQATEWGGVRGTTMQVALNDPEGRTVEWRGAVRGVWSLEATWETEADASSWLSPLKERLLASVVWEEPMDLVRAREDAAARPGSTKAAQALAIALARAGESEESLRLVTEILDKDPTDLDANNRYIEVATLTRQVDDGRLDAALATGSHKLAVAVVVLLEGLDRKAEATGILELLWRDAPGDRTLRRARKQRGLPTALTEDDQPWDLALDPRTAEPYEVPPLSALPRTLQGAAQAGSWRAELMESLHTSLMQGDSQDPLPKLLYLHHGTSTATPEEVEATENALSHSEAPRWLPPEVWEAVRR